MNNGRIGEIIRILASTPGYLTFDEIGRKIDISGRTVKKYMKTIEQNRLEGALLIKSRGRGYKLDVYDQEALHRYYPGITQDAAGFGIQDENARRIITYLLTTGDYISIADIAKRVGLGYEKTNDYVKICRHIMRPYHVMLTIRQNTDIRISGSEFNRRILTLELNLLPSEQNTVQGMRSADFRRIKQALYDSLEETGMKIFPFYEDKICMFFMFSMVRYVNGYRIYFEENVISALVSLGVYTVAQKMFDRLIDPLTIGSVQYEIASLALMLLFFMDIPPSQATGSQFSQPFDRARILLADVDSAINGKWHISLLAHTSGDILIPPLMSILFLEDFTRMVSHFALPQTALDRKIAPLPLSAALTAADTLSKLLGFKVPDIYINTIAKRLELLLDKAEYPYKKPVIQIASSYGILHARAIRHKIYHLIDNSFYESIEVSDSSANYTSAGGGGHKFVLTDYENWDADQGPAVVKAGFHTGTPLELIKTLFNSIFSKCYLTGDIYNSMGFGKIQVFSEFEFKTPEIFTDFICYKHCPDERNFQPLKDSLAKAMHLPPENGVLPILINTDYTKEAYFEVFLLPKKYMWHNYKSSAIVFIAVDFKNDPMKVKFINHVLQAMTSRMEEFLELYRADPECALPELVRRQAFCMA